ncbi:septation ring formation regulator EzrA [Erysipelotrichaceae bacterium]|nr:septation ring formation regulator EzrA [Erysipelotrichaceae bacterium]
MTDSLKYFMADFNIFGIAIPSWVAIVVAVSAVVLVLIIAIFLYSKARKNKRVRYQKQIDLLDARKNKMLAAAIEVSLSKIRTFEQTERVVTKYRQWLQQWQDIREELEKKYSVLLLELEDIVEGGKMKKFPTEYAEVEKTITDMEKTVKVLELETGDFVKNEESIHQHFESVKDTLKQVAQLFYANKSSLAPYTDQLKVQLEDLDKDLYAILDQMDSEDKKIVAEKLTILKTKILEEFTLLKELPNAIALNVKVLKPQMSVLGKAYEEMTEQGFLFQGLSLDLRIEKLKERVKEIRDLTDLFDLDMIESKGVYVRKQIEDIHKIFVNEREAKKDANRLIEQLNQRVNRLRFDKETFLESWAKVLKRYEISKEKVGVTDTFSAQVLSAETKMILFNNQLEKNQAAYVVLSAELKTFDQYLNELQYTLNKLQENLETVKEDEVYIHAQYKQLKYMHHRSKRKISQLPVESLSDEYLLKNDEAVLSLKDIEKNLEFEVLDVKRLTELIEIAQHLAIRFYKDTNLLIKAAAFAEKAIIYSNRYRFNREVQRNLSKATYLYGQGDYTEALDIALSTLETVEPGIYDMLFKAYESSVQKEMQ